MGSQFVDLNADGHLDYLTATFDGSPHIAWGSADGFRQPELLKDAKGERILISSIWDYEKNEHIDLGRAMPDGKARNERCISALAFDWDGDGDYDLLLGSYENGHLYRQMNEGTNKEPKFTGKNVPVSAGGAPIAFAAKMTTPKLVDWDGDGDLDLVVGTFGDSYGPKGTGGGVYLARNEGAKGKPVFAAFETLIAPVANGGDTTPVRPNAGLYPDVVDIDGDGDLDLVVGGFSMWEPPARELSESEQAQAESLQSEIKACRERSSTILKTAREETARAAEGVEPGSKEYQEVWNKTFARHSGDYRKAQQEAQALSKALGELVPAPRREAFVWIYERQ